MEKPNCSQCRHFFVTWDQKTPNGCRRYGIQSKGRPSEIVSAAGMGDCQAFEQKKKAQNKDRELDLNRNDLW